MTRRSHDNRMSFADTETDKIGADAVQAWTDGMEEKEARILRLGWKAQSRPAQRADGSHWDVWVMMAGRGFGKTRAGAEWIKGLVSPERHKGPKSQYRIALVAATLHEARSVMVEGESGILALYAEDPEDCPRWEPSLRQLTWPSGARAYIYGAAEAEGLRGPQHHYAWVDEIGKWERAERAWMNLRMGMRLGRRPRVLATTTPRHTALIAKLVKAADAEARIIMSEGKMEDNKSALPHGARAALISEYGGSALGRQELDGEYLTEIDDAQLKREAIEKHRIDAMVPEQAAMRMRRIVVAVDPPVSNHGDACGIVAVGLEDWNGGDDGGGENRGGDDGRDDGGLRAVLLEDASLARAGPMQWADAAIRLYDKWGAGMIVAEANQGGDMVITTLQQAARDGWGIAYLPVRKVHATSGKAARAEPVTLAYGQGRVVHAGYFPDLEDQMCGFTNAGKYEGPGRSPDRADAMVWAVTALLIEGRPKGAGDGPRIRVL